MKIQTPASHKNDPVTSYIAEESMNKGKRFTNQKTLTATVKRRPGYTAAELGQITLLGQHECSRRLSVLNGITVKHGERRKCKIKGTSMMTWEPLEES